MTGLSRRAALRSGLALGTGVLASGVLTPSASAAGRRSAPALVRSGVPELTHGVQSGDVSARAATVGARADRPSRLLVELALLANNWRRFLAQTPQVNQWDDHEVTNNWYPGERLDDDRYTVKDVDVLAARAARAFREYVPIAPTSRDSAGRIYRVLHYGPLLDVFVLDMRTYKDPNTTNRETETDGGVLGREQTAWLKRQLRDSRAVWKVIAADLPIGLVVSDGAAFEGIANADAGMPLGRELDLAQVLSFLKHEGIRNHVWLTADVHYTAAHHYSPERAAFTDFDPFWEFVAGPLNAGGFGPAALDPTFGPTAVFMEPPRRPNISPAEGHQYVGEVGIDGDTAQMTVRLRGIDGSVRWSTTLDPA